MRVRCRWKAVVIAGSFLAGACQPISKLPSLPPDEIAAEKRKQEIEQLRDYFAQLNRLYNVPLRIRGANSNDCKGRAWAQIGLNAGPVASLPRKYRSFS